MSEATSEAMNPDAAVRHFRTFRCCLGYERPSAFICGSVLLFVRVKAAYPFGSDSKYVPVFVGPCFCLLSGLFSVSCSVLFRFLCCLSCASRLRNAFDSDSKFLHVFVWRRLCLFGEDCPTLAGD